MGEALDGGPLIEARSLTKVYGPTTALDDVSLTVDSARPMLTAVAGESGSGKTTLAWHLMGSIRPTSGEVRYRGRDVTALARADRLSFRREVQAVFQDPYEAFNPFYRVDHVLEVPVRRLRLAPSGRQAREMIVDALERVGLRPGDTLGRFPHQLSGGQRQRIMVARAWLTRPRVLIADEPVSMVDASLRATILGELRQLHREAGVAILYITHDLTTAYQLCDRIMILYRGALVESGPVDEVILSPRHPYTQLLVSSIPRADGPRTWLAPDVGEERAAAPVERATEGCSFAPRCPHAMDRCWREKPGVYQTPGGVGARCFLHDVSDSRA